MSTLTLPSPIPIRIDPSFFFVTVVLGARSGDPARIAAWVVIVFVSVLLHELGHAAAARVFGHAPRIELHGMGGTTHWGSGGPPPSAGQRLVVALAGPFTGIAAGLAVLFLSPLLPLQEQPLLKTIVTDVLWVNLGWGVLNLLPMLPLDGGQALQAVLDALTNGKGTKPTLVVTVLVAIVCVLGALKVGLFFGAILCGLFGYQAVQALRR